MGTKTRRPPAPEWARWLKARGYSLAPLTGTDYKSLDAVAALWHLFIYTRDENLLAAIGYAARHMQDSTLFFARELAAHAGNWADRDEWWPHVERARRISRDSINNSNVTERSFNGTHMNGGDFE